MAIVKSELIKELKKSYPNFLNKDLNKIILDGQEHLNLIKVIRKSIDDNINVTDGLGFIYLCKITNRYL